MLVQRSNPPVSPQWSWAPPLPRCGVVWGGFGLVVIPVVLVTSNNSSCGVVSGGLVVVLVVSVTSSNSSGYP